MITNTTFHVPFVMMISMKKFLQLYEIKDVQNTFLQYKRLVILCKHIRFTTMACEQRSVTKSS